MKSPVFDSELTTLVLIDGLHLNSLSWKHNVNVEFQIFRALLDETPLLGSPRYYTTVQMVKAGEPANNVMALLSWLQFNRYNVITQEVFQIKPDSGDGVSYTPSHIMMSMCIDALSLYAEQGYQRLLIVSGNREVVPFLQYLRDLGVQIDVISSLELGAASPEVRSNCDNFYEFTDIVSLFYREKDKPTT